MSALLRKSVTDLTRRKARALFSILTLALAVASISIFAVPELIDRSMQSEVRAERLAHLTVSTRPLPLSDAQLADARGAPQRRGGRGPERGPDAGVRGRSAALPPS